MNDMVVFLFLLTMMIILLVGFGVLQLLHRIEQKLDVSILQLNNILRSVSATQSDVRQRFRSDGVEPIIDRPKAEQHYEGRGVKRTARGGKADPASGEGIAARISSVKRRSYGGTSGNPPGGGLL